MDEKKRVRRYAPHKKWSPEEIEKLIYLRERYTQKDIARLLDRSPSSVKCKINELDLGGFMDNTDLLTLKQASEMVGVSEGVIHKTWRKYGLKTKKKGFYSVISEKQLIQFMKNHPERWSALKCDYYMFYRFPWFIDKLEKEKADFESVSHYMKRKPWTIYEVNRLILLKKRGLSHKEIAAELGRTKISVDHKVMRLYADEITA